MKTVNRESIISSVIYVTAFLCYCYIIFLFFNTWYFVWQ